MKSTQNLKTISWIFTIFSFLGFSDATFLTVEHFLGSPIPCSVFGGCDAVTNSVYSNIGPIPIALLGSLYYLTLVILGIIYIDTKKEIPLKIASYITVVGFLVSLILVYLQIFVINAICLYCMISALISLVLFLSGQGILYNLRRKNIENSI